VLLLLALAAPLCLGQQPLPTPAAEVASERNELAKASGPHDNKGKRHGKWRLPREGGLRSESGAPNWIGHEEGLFEHGRREGEWVQFGKDGLPFGMRTYKADILDGPWSDVSGGTQMEGVFRSGQAEGPTKIVTKMADGSVCTVTGNYIAGKKHGLWVDVTTGSKKQIGHARVEKMFEHGVQVGATYWHDNGVISCTVGYQDGLKDGETKQWHRNEQLERTQLYRRGRLDGRSSFWHANGKKAREEDYRDDKLHGAKATWHANGQLASESQFVAGKEVGPFREWAENGNLVEHWVMVGRARNYLVSRNPIVRPGR
jgi:antitoxin component YwqK of YwqJK toxin-antitoxin module